MSIELTRQVRDLRIKLARDVIARLDIKAFEPTSGTYIRFRDLDATGGKVACQACAIGAAALVVVDPDNRLGLLSHQEREEVRPVGLGCFRSDRHPLRGIFSPEEMQSIEAAFEGWEEEDDDDNGPGYFRDRRGIGIDDEHRALRAIYQGIIDHDGDLSFLSAD